MLPYIWACGRYRGYVVKGLLFFAIVRLMDAFYDCGMYFRFFVHGPLIMRKIVALDPAESFASIQMRLFMRHCAKIEIEKAKGDLPRKKFTELVLARSFRNQIFDFI
mgnify:CR=1 FL=1|jgi:hypothetical protein